MRTLPDPAQGSTAVVERVSETGASRKAFSKVHMGEGMTSVSIFLPWTRIHRWHGRASLDHAWPTCIVPTVSRAMIEYVTRSLC